MLEAGIDVFSTVNVQHLESLNDRVAELTGVRVRETFPDTVLAAADEVVLIDLTPEALIERLRAGKVYPAERIEASLQQLLQDREPRGAARARAAPGRRGGRVEARRPARSEPVGTRERVIEAAPQAVGERVLALVTPRPTLAAAGPPGLALGAAARRRARPALGAGARPRARGRGAASSSARSAGSPRCSAPSCWSRRATTSLDVAAEVAAERGTTYMLIGQPPSGAGSARLARVAARAADAAAARRRRADRRRPSATRRSRGAE